jgi:hypothetical protein
MKTAFLILAHQRPDMVARLAGRLAHPDARPFVHVDRKAAIAPFQAALAGQAEFVPEAGRVDVRWCGFSTLAAVLVLARTALAAAPAAERFVLLSGADYPARPIGEILDALEPDAEHVAIDRRLDPKGGTYLDSYVARTFLTDLAWLNERSGLPVAARLARAVERRLPRLTSYPLPIYHGAAWWALTRAGLEAVLAMARADPRLVSWFRWARVPDELAVHTLLMASDRADRIAPAGQAPHRHGVHYIDWENPNPDLPRTLELSDLPAIQASGALFARKMDPDRSAALMDALDALAAPQMSLSSKAS